MRPHLLLALCFLLSAVSFAQSEPSPDAKAQLIFFREGHFNGSALKPSVYVDGKVTNRLANGRWFSVEENGYGRELRVTFLLIQVNSRFDAGGNKRLRPVLWAQKSLQAELLFPIHPEKENHPVSGGV